MSDEETSHLSNLSDGAGCTEIWEHLSEQRAAEEAESEAEEDETADDQQATDDSTDEASEKNAAGVPCP